MRQLVYAFYDQMFSVKTLAKKYPDVMGDWTDVLIGNLDKDFSNLFAAMGEQTSLPTPITYGKPFTAEKGTVSG